MTTRFLIAPLRSNLIGMLLLRRRLEFVTHLDSCSSPSAQAGWYLRAKRPRTQPHNSTWA